MIRAILVDDEPLARARMRVLLSAHAELELVGEAGDLASAEALVESARPEVVFLDIQLPGASGFDLLPALPEGVQVVFVTAFDNYAVRAFEVMAVDYLTKPVSAARLAQTIARLRAGSKPPAPALQKIKLPLGKELRWVSPTEIYYLRAAGDYSELILEEGALLTERRLRDWEAILPAALFVRIHRSTIVGLHRVRAARRGAGGVSLELLGGELLSVSRRLAPGVLSRLKGAGLG